MKNAWYNNQDVLRLFKESINIFPDMINLLLKRGHSLLCKVGTKLLYVEKNLAEMCFLVLGTILVYAV
jgi:hypothetical protein